MKHVVIGAHLERKDIEPLAEALAAGGMFLSALSLPDDQPLGDRALLLRVADVRDQLLQRATFIAIRYGLAVASPEEAASRCAAHVLRWRALLERSKDAVEMTLKVIAVNPQARPDRHAFNTGSAYLKALHQQAQATDLDPAFRSAVDERMVPLARKHRWIHRDGSSLEFVALVERSRLDDLRDAAQTLKAGFSAVPFLLSGPWPLEVFADDDHE